jgi:Rps23 Pro-64 3,4-dihydroxylase Tpa1-like proline 4-hydroxylase
MNNLDKISIVDFKQIDLSYILRYCPEDTWTDGYVAKSRYSSEMGSDINKDIRDVKVAKISDSLYNILNVCIFPYIQKYAEQNNILVSQNVGYHVTKYSQGQFFKNHVDSTPEAPRKISAILYLNDDYEGGTLTFTKLNKTFKPKAGSLFIFPSSKEFSHSADPVISGTKYVIVGFWL